MRRLASKFRSFARNLAVATADDVRRVLNLTISYWGPAAEHLFVEPWDWEDRFRADPSFRGYEVLDLWEARRVLDEMAAERRARKDLRRLAPAVLLGVHPSPWPPDSYEDEREERSLIERVRREALGADFSRRGEPPEFARVYICRRKFEPRTQPSPPNPWKRVHEALEAAQRGPRGFLSVQTTNEAGDAVPNVRLDVVLANGDLHRCCTDAEGQLRLESVPQGRCTIRVPELDGGAWRAEGGASSQVERGHKKLHTVKRGENLTLIAQRHGIKGWRTLWDAPDNAELRKKRRSPHVLWPGDELVLPAIAVHEITRPTDQTHRLVLEEELVEFRVVLQDHNQQPFADEPYELRFDAARRRGTTDGTGKVIELVRCDVEQIEVALPEIGLSWRFQLSDFVDRPGDEVRDGDEVALAQAVKATQLRLNALGFPCGAADGRMDIKTREALALAGQPEEGPLAALDHVEPMFAGTV